jgi:hypothetical protein
VKAQALNDLFKVSLKLSDAARSWPVSHTKQSQGKLGRFTKTTGSANYRLEKHYRLYRSYRGSATARPV